MAGALGTLPSDSKKSAKLEQVRYAHPMPFLCLAWLLTPFVLFIWITGSKNLSKLVVNNIYICKTVGVLAVLALIYSTFFLVGTEYFYPLYFLATPLIIMVVFIRNKDGDDTPDWIQPRAPVKPDDPPAPDWSDDLLDKINDWHRDLPPEPSAPQAPREPVAPTR